MDCTLPRNKLGMIPLERAMAVVSKVAGEFGLDERHLKIYELLSRSLPIADCDGIGEVVDGVLLKNFILNFASALRKEDINFFTQDRGYTVDRIVDVEEFTESKEYMAQAGHIRPVIKYELDRLFNGGEFIEAVLSGAIGIGKNYFADMAMAYQLYLLSVLKNPQMEYGLAPGSSIVFIMQSLSLTLAKKVVFNQFAERLRLSPYFMQNFPFDPNVKSELRFPNNVYILPVGGQDTGAIGMNVFGGVIDELNFMAKTQNSVHLQHSVDDEYDQAERLYSSIIRRMKSRFMVLGKVPGKLLLISSVNYPGDFTHRKEEEALKDKSIFVMHYAQWEALPSDRFCGEYFYVEVGNEYKRSRILSSSEEAQNEDDVIEVPVEYRTEFERDLEAALRDLAGVATGTKSPFIPYREQIKLAQDNFDSVSGLTQLFKQDSIILSNLFHQDEIPDWDQLVYTGYLDEMLIDQRVPFAAHIDVGLTNDAAGLAIGRISGYKLLPSVKYYSERAQGFIEVKDARAPVFTIDGLLQIRAAPNDEVDLELLRDLILWLRGHMFIKWATMDSYQSAMMIQGFRKGKIRSGVLSVDTSIAPYAELKQAIKDERMLFPTHNIASKELREVERDAKKDKIDHPEGGTKDVSDAMAGVVYMLSRKEANYGSNASTRRRNASTGEDGKRIRKVHVGGRRVHFRHRR